MLLEKVDEQLQKQIKLSPCHTNRASELGHACERYLVLRRTRWQEATLPDLSLQRIFNEGHIQERAVIRELEDAGFQVIEQQRDYEWKEYQITAHLDGKVCISPQVGDGTIPNDGHSHTARAVPLEVKSMSPYIFKSIQTAADLMNPRYPHLAKYIAQLQIYMLLSNADKAVLILKDKSSGQLKELWMELDYHAAEALIQKAQRINAAVAAGTIPERIPYAEKICGRCPFLAICLPDVKRDALEITTDPELEANLKRRHELAPLRAEYEQLDEAVKAVLKEHEKIVVGDFLVQGRWIEPKGKPKYWKVNIDKLEATKEMPA